MASNLDTLLFGAAGSGKGAKAEASPGPGAAYRMQGLVVCGRANEHVIGFRPPQLHHISSLLGGI